MSPSLPGRGLADRAGVRCLPPQTHFTISGAPPRPPRSAASRPEGRTTMSLDLNDIKKTVTDAIAPLNERLTNLERTRATNNGGAAAAAAGASGSQSAARQTRIKALREAAIAADPYK